ncbi:hypothetical protein H0H81_002755 [Sphagnurus paluster]|uniref:Uncharacterized protein n=1 Tax=Sphagnurus paluster TaxID=117069 RepID=A0A9P7GTT5_9AGAR|nr:hypothetical protein H0H81_002755 [Sphagnurus paluster]
MGDPISFTIELAPGIMSELATQGYSLCMSNVVGASEEGNVATVALPPTGEHGKATDLTIIFMADDKPAYSTTNKFSWNVAYSIGAMNVPWQDGGRQFLYCHTITEFRAVQVESQSEVVAVPIGQCYELDEWSSPPKIIKGVAGKLQFTTNKYDAAPVVYLAKVTANSNKVAPAPSK